MLRSVPGATEAAAILGRALAEARDAEVRAAAPGIVADLPVIVARPGRAAPGRLVAAE